MAISATFAVARYGEHASAIFCRYWTAKMSFLKRLSDSKAGEGGIFTDEALAGFEEPADFRELAETAEGHVLARILRALRPA